MLYCETVHVQASEEVRQMNFLEERIAKDGIVKPGNVLKVDSFLNHQMDISLMDEIGREFHRRFERSEEHTSELQSQR